MSPETSSAEILSPSVLVLGDEVGGDRSCRQGSGKETGSASSSGCSPPDEGTQRGT